MELKKCGCGEVPKELHIDQGHTYKWAWACGDCCGEWNIEFRTDYAALDSKECMDLAVEEWNNAPRPKTLR